MIYYKLGKIIIDTRGLAKLLIGVVVQHQDLATQFCLRQIFHSCQNFGHGFVTSLALSIGYSWSFILKQIVK